MIKTGTLTRYDIIEGSTCLEINIPEELKKLNTQDGSVEVRIDDGESISIDQRKKIFALISDICLFSGDSPAAMKEIMKYWHISRTGCDYFSLSDCSMALAKEFINTLVEHCLEWSIPLSESAILRTDDMFAYLVMCHRFKVCCICGRPGNDHHTNVHDEVISLCRQHGDESKLTGWELFSEKYKVFGIKQKYIERG